MFRKCDWAVLAVVLGLGGGARADFNYSYERDDAGSGFDRLSFFALSNPATAPDVGTRVVAFDLTLEDLSGHDLLIKFDGAAPRPPDLTGLDAPDPYQSDRSFINTLGDPANAHDSDPSNLHLVQINPRATFANYANGVGQFNVVGSLGPAGGIDATSATNGGKGALIGVAVVPSGDTVRLVGQIGGILAGSPPRTVDVVAPDPASPALVAVVAIALLPRRHRTTGGADTRLAGRPRYRR